MIKHIIFDFDGTIADSSHLTLQIINKLSEKYYHRKFTLEELTLLKNYPIKERFKKLGIPLYKIPRISLDTLNIFKGLVNSINVFDGISELVADLKAEGFQLSIISSNSRENINRFLENNDLDAFEGIISVKKLFGKHNSISKYLKRRGLKPGQVIYIGDELRDIESCKKASVKIISVTWGYDPVELLSSGNPDYIVHRPEEILEILKGLNAGV